MLVDSRIIHHLCIPSFPTLESLAVSLWLATGGVPDFDLVIAAGAPSLRHLSIIGLQDFAIDYKSLLRQLPLLGSLSLCRATKTLPLVGPWVPPCLTTLTAWCLSYVPPGIPNHPPVLHKYLSAVTLSLSLPGFANLKRLVVPEVPESTWQKSNDAKTLLATKTLVANCDDRGIAVFCRGRIWMVCRLSLLPFCAGGWKSIH